MIIRTSRSRLHTFVDAVLTAIAWILFIYLFGSSLIDILSGYREGGPDLSRVERFLPTVGTLGIYALVALVNAAVLLTWALYNAHRFRGVDRRKPPAPLTDVQLAQSFGLPPEQRAESATAKSMTIHHGKDGNIEGIDIHMGLPAMERS
ncbi:poly-beta-1,6-N-acetyl-D-glucosamine biosynthesis protein PgaD [Hydrogenophaga sp.]|uniref:poly-beta-1,6-N-acetyl-D-glucosamine biosynthesis protein PgaD n=1 Tax=Hydrogenophaga sp. TaxID=1904254 RepID=UPI00271EB00C|nr:poly-beta-1,6-N-acetyl-D-glucosamine biosynthesis protein PgaD [Hydrogenophaga sp.]MDO9435211.1 poly-beta-1,6-N-acetyl-D-glucosamine biosynthesis protein PgaD [Hydrogenophaga sp.]